MLDKIKILLGITDASKDELLTLLIQQAQEEAINYIHDDNLSGLDNTLIQMVIYKFNLLGTEGLESEAYSGVSYRYASDYPETILKQLKSHRRVRVVND